MKFRTLQCGFLMYNKHMLIIGLLSWWYGAGWLQLMQRQAAHLNRTIDFFSITLLLKTLFSPYRQISAGSVRGAVGVQLRAWFDRQVSRIIGAFVRLTVIVFGLLATALVTISSLLVLLIWPLIPTLPVIVLIVLTGITR